MSSKNRTVHILKKYLIAELEASKIFSVQTFCCFFREKFCLISDWTLFREKNLLGKRQTITFERYITLVRRSMFRVCFKQVSSSFHKRHQQNLLQFSKIFAFCWLKVTKPFITRTDLFDLNILKQSKLAKKWFY